MDTWTALFRWVAGLSALQWSHDLSAMDTPLGGVDYVTEFRYLQWSHDLSAMDTWTALFRWVAGLSALQWSHDLSAHRALSFGTFNGAMTSQPWIHLAVLPAHRAPEPFNGAMTSQPWIRHDNLAIWRGNNNLQWSHDLSAMDTLFRVGAQITVTHLQWSHDLSAMDTPKPCVATVPTAVPSMEP